MEILFCVQIKQSSRSSHNTFPDLHNLTNAPEEEKSVEHADSSATFNATNVLTIVCVCVGGGIITIRESVAPVSTFSCTVVDV